MLPDSALSCREDFENHCRAGARSAYLGVDRLVAKILGYRGLFLDPLDIGITPHLALDGFWESWVSRFMAMLIQPGWTCFDIGANCGYYSILMGEQAGQSGRVFSFEPNARLTELIAMSRHLNGQDTRINTIALADEIGTTRFSFEPGYTMNARIGEQGEYKVNVDTVDAFCERNAIGQIDLMKVDVEGAELKLWNGSQKMKPNIKHLIIEFNSLRYGERAGEFLDSLSDGDKSIAFIGEGGMLKSISREEVISGPERMLYFAR